MTIADLVNEDVRLVEELREAVEKVNALNSQLAKRGVRLTYDTIDVTAFSDPANNVLLKVTAEKVTRL